MNAVTVKTQQRAVRGLITDAQYEAKLQWLRMFMT